MGMQQNLIEQLEEALVHKEIGRRAETLRRVTDLFVSGSGRFTVEQIELFDDVLSRLAEEIELSARAAFGARLAPLSDAPPRVLRGLALDDAIEVAGPILSLSERLDDATLVETARIKSQNHLLAIARRKVLAESVTDVLVDRGNREVVHTAAENAGARFSEVGYSALVEKAGRDGDLALTMWMRPEIPRQSLLTIFAQASESLRARFEAADPTKAGVLTDMLAQASNQIQTASREASPVYVTARSHILSLQRAGKLNEEQLANFARSGKFDEAAITLSIIGDLPIGVVERAITSERMEQILVLAKSLDLDWQTVEAILQLQVRTNGSASYEPDECRATFERLQSDMAKKAVQFLRLRERAAGCH